MNEEKKISIIVPVYNICDLLKDMLGTIVNQTHKCLEIILVDDGSKDGSGLICDEWAKKDSRIKCIHQENAGVSTARNVGFNQSTGDYILFIDGDDEIATDMCEKMLNRLLADDADVCYCGFLNIFQDKTEKVVPESKVLVESEILHELVTEVSFFTAIWNKLFRRSILQNKQGEFIEFTQGIYVGEDALWLSKVLKNARSATALPEALYCWKRRESSATQGSSSIRTDEKYLSVLEAYKKMINELCDNTSRNIICKRYLGVARDCMIQAYK
ncbi:MAG: glycosyltransferase, partial [Lachnospiraceae bacterium]|nr:glycosyltransferase [Lachnospiraceae bacterium]